MRLTLLLSLSVVTITLGAVLDSQLIFNSINKLSNNPIKTLTRWNYNDCGGPNDAIKITSLRVSPDPPKPGQNLTIYATGTANELINPGAYADVIVKLGLIKLLTKRFDVCDELANANSTLQCPVQPNDYEVVQTVALPREIPRAKFQVQVHAFTVEENPMACLTIDINFLMPDLPPTTPPPSL